MDASACINTWPPNVVSGHSQTMYETSNQHCDTASYDSNKSTKGASKLRRDLINGEISVLRDLLPLPATTRQRLSQLQLMALVCVYVRKANYFEQFFKQQRQDGSTTPQLGFSKALSGFILIMCQNGKLLYISDNAAEYLGHSMEDLLIHGDSVYDIVDKQDQQAVQSQLTRSVNQADSPGDDVRQFLCRINVSRNARRQMRFGDQKVVLVRGHFCSFLPLCSRNEPVFVAVCTPVVMPETRECVVQGATNVFTSLHAMDMKFTALDHQAEYYLGYSNAEVQGQSWYNFVHWSDIKEAQSKHKLIVASDQERSSIALLRLQTRSGQWLWLHCVLQVKEGGLGTSENTQQTSIVCTCQVLSEDEAEVMRTNSWLYHYYSMQSKMQYSLAYDSSAQPSNYYPHMFGYTSGHLATQPQSHFGHQHQPVQADSPLQHGYMVPPSHLHHSHLHPHHPQHTHLHHTEHLQHAQYSAAVDAASIQQQYTYPDSMAYAHHQHPAYAQFSSTTADDHAAMSTTWTRYENSSASVADQINSFTTEHTRTATATGTGEHYYPAAETTQRPANEQKRPPTPPRSPRRKMCATTVVPPEASAGDVPVGNGGESADENRSQLPPIKRRLMSYNYHSYQQYQQYQQGHHHHHHQHSHQLHTMHETPGSGRRFIRTTETAWNGDGMPRPFADVGSPHSASDGQSISTDRGKLDHQLDHTNHDHSADNSCRTDIGSVGVGVMLATRPSAMRLTAPVSKISYHSGSSTPELELTTHVDMPHLPWNLSPPWSECNQRVPELALTETTSHAGGSACSPQALTPIGTQLADQLTIERRMAMTANWADCSLVYPVALATPSPTGSACSVETSITASGRTEQMGAANGLGQQPTDQTQYTGRSNQREEHLHQHSLNYLHEQQQSGSEHSDILLEMDRSPVFHRLESRTQR